VNLKNGVNDALLIRLDDRAGENVRLKAEDEEESHVVSKDGQKAGNNLYVIWSP
jgi:hypothetical protein